MDGFAQTRGADDLFDDDFTPLTEPEHQTYQPTAEPLQSQKPPPPPQYLHEHIPRGPKNGSRAAPTPNPDCPSQAPPTPSQIPPTTGPPTTTTSNDSNAAAAPLTTSAADTTSTTPRPPRAVAAVRGDRLATGGTPKPKLTEEELSAKLTAAKINSEKRAEAHRLAEADEASFQQREAKATERRKEEGKARRVMDMEREKNRLRKLEAGKKGAREWDEGKEEEVGMDRRVRYQRGANGAVSGGGFRGDRYPHAQQPGEEGDGDFGQGEGSTGRGRGRGRGEARGRGDRGRGGRGRGRGGANMVAGHAGLTEQKPPDPTLDFPALPTGPKPIMGGHKTLDTTDASLQSPVVHGASWADQVNEKES